MHKPTTPNPNKPEYKQALSEQNPSMRALISASDE